MLIPFIKMVAVGNDYVYFDAIARPELARRDDLAALARWVSDRRTGIGADGLIVMQRGSEVDGGLSMRIFNADGTDGGVCGNGARCVIRLALERGYVDPGADGSIALRCGGRDLSARVAPDLGAARSDGPRITIDMGPPTLTLPEIPVNPSLLHPVGPHEHEIDGVRAVFVSMGNPHMVVFQDPASTGDIRAFGPHFEAHRAFPMRMNVHLVNCPSRDRAELRTWERGAGHTLGCGTGSCAVLVAGVLTGRLESRAEIVQPGGTLRIEWAREGAGVLMSGPTELVFEGEFDWPRESPSHARSACMRVETE